MDRISRTDDHRSRKSTFPESISCSVKAEKVVLLVLLFQQQLSLIVVKIQEHKCSRQFGNVISKIVSLCNVNRFLFDRAILCSLTAWC